MPIHFRLLKGAFCVVHRLRRGTFPRILPTLSRVLIGPFGTNTGRKVVVERSPYRIRIIISIRTIPVTMIVPIAVPDGKRIAKAVFTRSEGRVLGIFLYRRILRTTSDVRLTKLDTR